MLQSNRKQFILVFVINLIIALGFYIGNLKTNYASLSSDIQNIIPVAQKFDNPELFKKDLYLNSLDNVRYYTPFYVQSLRFLAKFTRGNYIQAINLMSLICHLLFGILWFFLIYRFVSNFWIALLISLLVRGVVWLPGLEVWGISSLWSMMPRTVYITLFPLPFLILNTSFRKIALSAFLVGLVFNFHPITGLGGILLYLSFITFYVIIYKYRNLVNLKNSLGLLVGLIIGMLPFVLTYFGKTSSIIDYDMNMYNEAFNKRIPSFFKEPAAFLGIWIKFKTLFYVMPIIIYYIISWSNKKYLRRANVIVLLTLILLFLPLISVYVERLINSVFSLNLRLSFQLIRAQKIAIVPSFFAMAYILEYANSKIKSSKFLPSLCVAYIVLLVICKLPMFNSVPFIGNDVSRSILPNTLSLGGYIPYKKGEADLMSDYINENIPQDVLLFGSHHYRGATKRSVILDSKGASMIIEGNPAQFIQARENQKKLAKAKTIIEKIEVLRSLDVDYIITRNIGYGTKLSAIYTTGSLSLYKL